MAEIRRRGKKNLPTKTRPIIEPAKIYSTKESAEAVGCGTLAIFHARQNGHLDCYRVGRLVKHSGAQLLAWLEAGGRIGPIKQKHSAAQI